MRRKLLLADDSITVQRVIELTFADEDLDVSTVGDGGEAIARIERDRPDIVLADLTMPVRDGYGVAEHVKRTPALAAHTRVVLLTGAFEPVDQERASDLGVDGVLAKPFEPRVAIELVRALLTQPPQEAKPVTGGALFVPLPEGERREGVRQDGDAGAPGDRQEPRATAAAGYPFEPDSGSPRSTPAELDDYFKRLDEALASAGLVASSAVRDMLAESKVKAASAAAGPVSTTASTPAQAAADGQAQSDRQAPSRQEQEKNAMSGLSPSAQPSPAPGAPAGPPPAGQASGTLVDAFSALLAAEQGDPAEEGSAPEPRAFRPESVAAPALSAVPAAAAPSASASSASPSSTPSALSTPSASSGGNAVAAAPSASAPASASAPGAVSIESLVLNDALIEAVAKRVVDQLGDRIVRDVVNATVVDIAERLVREEIERLKAAAARD
jgi:CheY-like chemotaxis protein